MPVESVVRLSELAAELESAQGHPAELGQRSVDSAVLDAADDDSIRRQSDGMVPLAVGDGQINAERKKDVLDAGQEGDVHSGAVHLGHDALRRRWRRRRIRAGNRRRRSPDRT